jgi:hypothetical protein
MNGLESLSFEEACAREAERERNYPPEFRTSRPHSYLSRGLYADLLAHYVSRFPPSRMLVLRFEDVLDDPQTLIAEVHRFLGVGARPADGRVVPPANASVPPAELTLAPGLRQHLQEVYGEPNARLQRLLGRPAPFWVYRER